MDDLRSPTGNSSCIETIHRRMIFHSPSLAYNINMLEEGFWAELQIAGEHLRLFAEESPQGFHASVYNMKTKTWLMPSETASSVDNGKHLAEQFASQYLKQFTAEDVPRLEWKKSRSV
jgi:hypothetical protein